MCRRKLCLPKNSPAKGIVPANRLKIRCVIKEICPNSGIIFLLLTFQQPQEACNFRRVSLRLL